MLSVGLDLHKKYSQVEAHEEGSGGPLPGWSTSSKRWMDSSKRRWGQVREYLSSKSADPDVVEVLRGQRTWPTQQLKMPPISLPNRSGIQAAEPSSGSPPGCLVSAGS
jgi:hypothetical protein